MIKRQLQSVQEIKNLGLFGLHSHAGVTWISVLLACYLTQICGKSVGVIEHSQKRDMLSLAPERTRYEENYFTLHKIGFLSNEGLQLSMAQKDREFDFHIYDLGCNFAKARDMIQTCDRTIFIYTMTPWYCDKMKLETVLNRDYGITKQPYLLGNMISKTQRKEANKLLHHSEFLGYEPNLFHPSKSCIQVFDHILWG